MIKFRQALNALFRRPKRFSLTTTDTNEGMDKPEEIYPPLKDIYEKILENDHSGITAEEVNILLQHKFKQTPYYATFFKFNEDILTSCLFKIDDINFIIDDKTKEIDDMVITFKEDTMESKIILILSAKEINLFLKEFHFQDPFKKDSSQ